jgi:hypothetical protein
MIMEPAVGVTVEVVDVIAHMVDMTAHVVDTTAPITMTQVTMTHHTALRTATALATIASMMMLII